MSTNIIGAIFNTAMPMPDTIRRIREIENIFRTCVDANCIAVYTVHPQDPDVGFYRSKLGPLINRSGTFPIRWPIGFLGSTCIGTLDEVKAAQVSGKLQQIASSISPTDGPKLWNEISAYRKGITKQLDNKWQQEQQVRANEVLLRKKQLEQQQAEKQQNNAAELAEIKQKLSRGANRWLADTTNTIKNARASEETEFQRRSEQMRLEREKKIKEQEQAKANEKRAQLEGSVRFKIQGKDELINRSAGTDRLKKQVLRNLTLLLPSVPVPDLVKYLPTVIIESKINDITSEIFEKIVAGPQQPQQSQQLAEPVIEGPPQLQVLREDLDAALKDIDNLKLERLELQKQISVDVVFVKQLVQSDLEKIKEMVDRQTQFLSELQSLERSVRASVSKIQEIELSVAANNTGDS